MPEATFFPLPHLACKAELASTWLGLTLGGRSAGFSLERTSWVVPYIGFESLRPSPGEQAWLKMQHGEEVTGSCSSSATYQQDGLR